VERKALPLPGYAIGLSIIVRWLQFIGWAFRLIRQRYLPPVPRRGDRKCVVMSTFWCYCVGKRALRPRSEEHDSNQGNFEYNDTLPAVRFTAKFWNY
jgi:hypothetical protein